MITEDVMNNWDGAEITNRLGIHPIEELPGLWSIHGKWDGQNAMGNAAEMVALAHEIILNLGEQPARPENKIDWLRDYRARTGADLRAAMAAWESQAHGG